MGLYFITTDHLEKKIWFRDLQDYIVGMNYVAVLAASMNVAIIAFILMSNHVHFLLRCSEAEAREFIDSFKKLYSMYYQAKYGESGFLRRNNVDIQRINIDHEGAEIVIAYIVMNSVAARICLTASGYRWGSGACYFNENKEKGIPIGSLSIRKQRKILKSHVKVPQDWLLSSDGYILPESYVRFAEVEKLYKTPARMQYFLDASRKARKALEKESPAFDDQLLVAGIRSLCVSLFNKKSQKDLTHSELSEMLRQLRWRFGADIHQISRVSGIPYEEVSELLNSLDHAL
jgi:REP element-mobilizing transposase RayT